MGVPAFYRWLVKKYPKVETQVVEESSTVIDGIEIPVDASKPNPNGVEIDNLYLDMNGIVHPCCHPQNKPAPATEDEMFYEIFKVLDRVFNMIRPRRTVYMALDGVAPRAKMNQQRSRRFRTAQEAKLENEKKAQLLKQFNDATDGDAEIKAPAWDSNCITPGTPFMENLAKALRYYTAEKLNCDPAWGKINVVISDSNVPGEGEHKLMEFIRNQRRAPNYDPNTSHVIYGLDADLIMLALATHEPHFKILREDVFAQEGKKSGCYKCGDPTHIAKFCKASELEINKYKESKKLDGDKFVFCNIDTLREYLEIQLLPPKHDGNMWDKVKGPVIDLERAIDDWVFMCFFVGNDFLPHLPSLEIREGALDKLVQIWKSLMYSMGGYVTNNGVVNLVRAQAIMNEMATLEFDTFVRRKKREDDYENRQKNSGSSFSFNNQANQNGPPQNLTDVNMVGGSLANSQNVNQDNKNAAKRLREELFALSNAKNQESSDESKRLEDQLLVSGDVGISEPPAKLAKKDVSDPSAEEKDDAGLEIQHQGKLNSLQSDSNAKNIPNSHNNSSKNEKPENVEYEDEELLFSGSTGVSPDLNEAQKIEREETKSPVAIAIAPDETLNAAIKEEEEEEEEKKEESEVAIVDIDVESSVVINKVDNVRFWEQGYKQRYYETKFEISANNRSEVLNIVKSYVEGLCWVLHYYYKGTASWSWYYPYHYAPLASDFINLDTMDIKFELGTPLQPFEQLMSVLPAASKDNLPKPFAELMVSEDSEILDFYPETFKIDLNGKKQLWQGVAILPFIDETRLINALKAVYPKLSPSEVARNSLGYSLVCVSSTNHLCDKLSQLYAKSLEQKQILMFDIESRISGEFSKDIHFIPHTTFVSPLVGFGKYDIEQDTSISAKFSLINVDNSAEQTEILSAVNSSSADIFNSLPSVGLLKGVSIPKPKLNNADKEFILTNGRSGYTGQARGNRFGNNRDFSHFYKQQGNDVYYDRGYVNPNHRNNGGNEGGDNNRNNYVKFNTFNKPSGGRPSYPRSQGNRYQSNNQNGNYNNSGANNYLGKFPNQQQNQNYSSRPQRPQYNQNSYRNNNNGSYNGNNSYGNRQNASFHPYSRPNSNARPYRPNTSFQTGYNSRYEYAPSNQQNSQSFGGRPQSNNRTYRKPADQ